ncbi:MAG: DNA repair protein RecO [Gammaproteobacteria bacterium RIFCSPLOWO2_02_FULL_47_50]|jgi:DNA repair protein RecO (recombination protein O)|nr:MAG: DNA repair protein RecO [Gammaproteobacteria bacterium RIFCSPLOWO2_01_FULL_47_190]OGT72615.1 MAG: DNA repair protein RecO [Gammaproteobacteria bacterium RIFCSPLOWO2_12_47_11]OGT81193.1 MAG: DNA repair protein RecO [Gammaproteobacteria bacterium RIFCSPLOWO2_02_FULL_47_50]OGT85233.1 MAG: DNA repair protein RecO [Gammaproteobacteria bacterium RIFCSPLOWO2_12_FULL_47_76]
MKVELNPAFILHRRPYRETSLLLDVFSRNYGRIGLLAKGIRKNKSNKPEILQPHQPLQLAWSGKGELMTLTMAEADKPAYILKDKKLIAGFYLNEIITRMLHQHEAHPDLYMIYDKTLNLLSTETANEQVVIRIFEKRLLDSLGYGLVLDHDVNGKKIKPDCDYYYQSDRGPVMDIPGKSDYIKISGFTLLAIKKEKFDSTQILHEAKLLMRFILKNHLGGKPLASRKLYKLYLENLK